ncbi:MAG TPA: sugar ABC transporter substrate-binding protein [Steroidobacteraceae bacterium]|nr:sugar ABC transporter substrate-binding protein [Gammaproteobacteria bacterium]HEV2286699.1 sugar ABC transporter substrate-binding protein [Steroidobacteraceae bacterium]
MQRVIPTLLAAVLAVLPAAAHAATIGVSMALFDDNFLTSVRASMRERAQQLGVPIQFEDAENDIGRQLNQIQNFIAQRVDAIIVTPVDTDATPRMTRLVAAAGIALVYVNRMPADRQLPPRVSFVGSDEAQSGTLEMAEVCRLLHGQGDIVVLMGELTNQSARQRTRDVQDVLARPACRGIHVLDKQAADWKRTAAADLMSNWLSAGLRPRAVVANDDEMAIGAIQSLKQARLLDSTIVAGIDATPDALAAMKAGELKVTVFQNAPAQGRGAVDTALRLMHNEAVPAFVWVPFELVTPVNLASYLGRPR